MELGAEWGLLSISQGAQMSSVEAGRMNIRPSSELSNCQHHRTHVWRETMSGERMYAITMESESF